MHDLEAEQQHWREAYRDPAATNSSSAHTPGKSGNPAARQLPVSRSASHLSPEAPPGGARPQPGRLGRAGEITQGNGGYFASAAASPGGVVVAADEGSGDEGDEAETPPGDLDELDGLIRRAH